MRYNNRYLGIDTIPVSVLFSMLFIYQLLLVPWGSKLVAFMFYVIVGKAFAENSSSTSLQRVALRRVVSLSSCYFLHLLLLLAILQTSKKTLSEIVSYFHGNKYTKAVIKLSVA